MPEPPSPAKRSALTLRPLLKAGYRSLERRLGRAVWLRPALRKTYHWAIRGRPWMRAHPFDAVHGIDTVGYLPWWLLGAGPATESNLGYGGCQPSCVRRALAAIPDPDRHMFLDVGCGKGRALVVASEFPFRAIAGIEIDPALCRACRDNAAAIRTRFPARTAIEIVESDARHADLPEGDLVAFIYHAFDAALLGDIVRRLVAAENRSLFVIYQNPVFGHLLDAEPRLRRWFAETVPCERSEQNVGSGGSETVVSWVLRSHPGSSWPGAEAVIEAVGSSARLRV